MTEESKPKKRTWNWSLTQNEVIDYITSTIPQCADMEMDWMKCAERVGLQRTALDCRLIFEDIQECRYNKKLNERLRLMNIERIKQNRPEIPMMHTDAEKYSDRMNTERS